MEGYGVTHTNCQAMFTARIPMITMMTLYCVLQIYSDWANHYLEKAKCKRRIKDLQADVADGVLLADVVDAVSKYLHAFYPLKSSLVAALREKK